MIYCLVLVIWWWKYEKTQRVYVNFVGIIVLNELLIYMYDNG